jgi:hypothetical protein
LWSGAGPVSKITISTPPIAVTRETAAEMVGMSLDSFERYVQPEVKLIRKGKLRLVPVDELRRWAEANAETTL